MNIILDIEQDRIINDLYVWVVEDKRTGLEGIFSMNYHGMQMQCATSSLDTAKKIGERIKELPFADKRFKLFRYAKAEMLEEF